MLCYTYVDSLHLDTTLSTTIFLKPSCVEQEIGPIGPKKMFCLLLLLCFATIVTPLNQTYRPHLVTVLADDLGWFDTAIYNPNSPTPALKNALDHGLRLDRHYVFRYCSPTRR